MSNHKNLISLATGHWECPPASGRKDITSLLSQQLFGPKNTKGLTRTPPSFNNSLKVSFHSRSQDSQASQQACVCDAHWYGNIVRTHSAKFGEGLRYSQSSRTCSTFVNTHEIRRVVTRYGNKKRRFAMLLCFRGTVLVLLFYVWGNKVWHMHNHGIL